MTTPHPHADILRALADGKKVELLTPQGDWKETGLTQVANYPATTFRIAPETISVNGVECPKPEPEHQSGCSARVRIHLDNCESPADEYFYFDSQADARTVFDALCKPFKEGV